MPPLLLTGQCSGHDACSPVQGLTHASLNFTTLHHGHNLSILQQCTQHLCTRARVPLCSPLLWWPHAPPGHAAAAPCPRSHCVVLNSVTPTSRAHTLTATHHLHQYHHPLLVLISTSSCRASRSASISARDLYTTVEPLGHSRDHISAGLTSSVLPMHKSSSSWRAFEAISLQPPPATLHPGAQKPAICGQLSYSVHSLRLTPLLCISWCLCDVCLEDSEDLSIVSYLKAGNNSIIYF